MILRYSLDGREGLMEKHSLDLFVSGSKVKTTSVLQLLRNLVITVRVFEAMRG